MSIGFFPEGFYPVSGGNVASDAGGWSTDIINLADAEMCYIEIHKIIAGANATTHTLLRGADTTTCATAWDTNAPCPIWNGIVTSTSTTLTRATDASVFTQGGAATGDQLTIIQVDPRTLGNDYKTIKLTISASGQANLTSVVFWIKPRYGESASQRPATEFIA